MGPIIARLYKESIIGIAYMALTADQAFAAKEPGRESSTSTATCASSSRTSACPLIWNIPPPRIGFYQLPAPLLNTMPMLGSCFCVCGRLPIFGHWWWDWTDVTVIHSAVREVGPPHTELSMHYMSRLRINQYEHVFDGRVSIKRDLFLVLGEDEDLLKYDSSDVCYCWGVLEVRGGSLEEFCRC